MNGLMLNQSENLHLILLLELLLHYQNQHLYFLVQTIQN